MGVTVLGFDSLLSSRIILFSNQHIIPFVHMINNREMRKYSFFQRWDSMSLWPTMLRVPQAICHVQSLGSQIRHVILSPTRQLFRGGKAVAMVTDAEVPSY